MRQTRRFCLSVLLFLAFSTSLARAQGGTGMIYGDVRKDYRGIAGVTVSAQHLTKPELTISATTNEHGSFTLDKLPYGLWKLSVPGAPDLEVPVMSCCGLGYLFLDLSKKWDIPKAPREQDKGIQQATAENIKGSEAAPEKTVSRNTPFMLRVERLGFSHPLTDSLVKFLGSAPFIFTIQTPITRATEMVKEAERKFTEPQLSLEKINAERVAIVVSPGSKMDSVDSIEQVVILRGGQTHRPTKADVVPTTLQNRMGATVEATKGAFYFPVELFNPDMPITVVLVGKKGNLEWTMPQDELRMLK